MIIKVVWILGSPKFPPIEIIIVLMVLIFVSSHSRYYLAMLNSKKDKYYYSLFMRLYDKCITSSDDRGDVGPRNTHFSSQNVDFSTDRYNGRFHPSHRHSSPSPVMSEFSMDH